jgi:NRPS condensation-like uncharacterized protein
MVYNRKLAPIEQSMEILNCCASSINIVTISHIKGALNEKIIRQAINLIQFRHPRLSSRIIGNLDSLRFEGGATEIPLRVVYKRHIDQWQEVVLEELNQAIDSSKCLARVVLVSCYDGNTHYLLTILHHAISDGLSSIQLHSEILTFCQNIVTGEIKGNIHSLPPLTVIQDLMPKSMQGKMALIKGILFLLRLRLKLYWYRPETLKLEKYLPIELRRSSIVQKKLSKENTIQLLEFCRKEKTTVHSALCAAMMLAVAKQIRGENRAKLNLSCRSNIDLRKRLQPEVNNENLGVIVSGTVSFHTLRKNTSFWNLARDVRRQLELTLKSEDIFSAVLMSKKIYRSILSRPDKAPVSVNVTNVGRINIPVDYGSFKLEEISFVSAQRAFGNISIAATTFQGIMILNFMFSEPLNSKERVEALANDVISYIVDTIDTSTTSLR